MIFSRPWRALMRRNLIYRKRKPIGSILELLLPVLFVSILVLIKKEAEQNISFKPSIVPPYFPSNKAAMKILSFTDYVTALQAQRICTKEPVKFYDALLKRMQELVSDGQINMFQYIPQYLALQAQLAKRREEREKLKSTTDNSDADAIIETDNNNTTTANTTEMGNSTLNSTNSTNTTDTSTGTGGMFGMDIDLDEDGELIQAFVLDIIYNDPNLAGVVEEVRLQTTQFFSITGIPDQGYNWQVPFVKCDSRLCNDNYENAADNFCEFPILAIAPEQGGIAMDRVKAFQAYILDHYPQLKNENDELSFRHDFIKMFDSNEDIETYVKDIEYGLVPEKPKIGLAILFSSGDDENGNEYKYTIRANATNFNSPEETARLGVITSPDTTRQFKLNARSDASSCIPEGGTPNQGYFRGSCTGQYMYNGVLTMQRLIHDFIIEDSGAKEQGHFVAEHGVVYLPFPSPSYERAGFLAAMAEFAPLFIILGFLYPVASMVSFIVSEKELRQKELMKMMSVDESDLESSWFCSFFIFHSISIVLTALVSMELFQSSTKVFLLLFWFLAFTSIIVFSQFLATLSSKTTRGVLIGLLVFFGGYILINVVPTREGSLMTIQMVSLHPAAAISYVLQEIARLEDSGAGITIDTMFISDSPSGFAFMTGINSLLLDIFFWGLFSWYINRVLVTSEYGQPLPLTFPFKMSYWFPGRERTELDQINMGPAQYDTTIPVEEVSDVLKSQAEKGQSIEIHDLRKSFLEKTAVDGLNLSIYSGQITALLGHNGAGKSTTINLLSGALAPTSGSATITGRDVTTDSNEIRKNIGICLQHDCLFPQLTVKEHVQFFCRLKGVYNDLPYKEAEEQVDNAIKDVSLFEKKNTLSKNLSGGMKRKLSVAMAFCGNSQVVFLDEPTSGMDPFSRRFTWNIIRKYRQNRCIILTTHFMDEADILGDRIAIMSEGRLCCVGSSFFLKKTYGVGYQLTIDRKTINRPETVTEGANEGENIADSIDVPKSIVKEHIKGASLLNEVGTELSFRLPLDESGNFPPMLEKLESEISNGIIDSYGLSITTLDEVFQIIARNEGNKDDHFESSTHLKTTADKNPEVESDCQSTTSSKSNNRKDLQRNKLFTKHLSALLRKRKSYYFRDKKAWCCTTILPSLFVLLGFVLLKTRSGRQDLIALPLKMEDYNRELKRNPIPYNTPDSNFTCQPGVCTYGTEVIQVTNLNQSETASIMKNETYYFCGSEARLSAPDVLSFLREVIEGEEEEVVNLDKCSIENSSNMLFRITEGGAFPVPHDVSKLNETSYSNFNSSKLFAETQYGAIYFTHEPDSMVVNKNSSFHNLSYSDAVYQTCKDNDGGDYVKAQNRCDNYKGIGYVISFNFSALHVTPMYQAIADEAIIREALNDDKIKISANIHPLPITVKEAGFGDAEDAFIVWFLIVLSFPFIGGAFATFVVTERQSKAKHLQTVAGVKPLAYWASTLLWDLINYQSPLWISIILAFAFDIEVLITKDRGVVGAVISLLFLYGPASACFAYTVSFAFTSPSLCNVALIVSGFLIGFGGPIAVFIMRLISIDPRDPSEKLERASIITEWVLRIIPSFCLGNGLYKAINIAFFDLVAGRRVEAWDSDVVLFEVVFLAIQTVVYFSLAVILDLLNSNPRAVSIWRILSCRLRGICSKIPTSTTTVEDDDVLNEEKRILSGDANDDMIVVSQLTKIYDTGKIAVNNLSLGIPPGQCFGLLGINGAGKTTTMGILTAEFPPTSGDATLAGYSVVQEPEKTRRRIGYCPQFDAHFENLTGREHVELYASIKGVPTENVKMLAAEKLAEVGLCDEDADRISSKYSGGMKRKLSIACATIGQPEIVFLDECTTGVDPVARREIWQLISDMVTKGETSEERTSVVLTTHSMEECEALCPRIGIMANGRLRCLGSAQHLKSKFGRGYQIEMTVKALTKDGDYSKNYLFIAKTKKNSKNGNNDEDSEANLPDNAQNLCFSLDEAKKALDALTDDDSLSKKISAEDETGHLIYNEATSEIGVEIDELASFVTMELRMRNVDQYISTSYPNSTKRERQDLKVRYEVSSEGTKISEIFAGIEKTKGDLQLADYGVSQTSLEQVFNMHAAEAEGLKSKE